MLQRVFFIGSFLVQRTPVLALSYSGSTICDISPWLGSGWCGAVLVKGCAHNITHFLSPFLLYRLSSGMVSRRPGAAPLAGLEAPPEEYEAAFCRLIILTTSKKAFSTLMQFFADASTNSHPSSRARAWPSCVDTSRSVTRSLLLPTSIMGTLMGPPAAEIGEPGYDDEPPVDSLTR